jgi:hypothetical protein
MSALSDDTVGRGGEVGDVGWGRGVGDVGWVGEAGGRQRRGPAAGLRCARVSAALSAR